MCLRLLQGTATRLLCVILVFEDSWINIWVHFGTFCTRKCPLSPQKKKILVSSNLFSVGRLKIYELSGLTNVSCGSLFYVHKYHQYFCTMLGYNRDKLWKGSELYCRARKVGFRWQWSCTSLKFLPFDFPPLCDCLLYITKAPSAIEKPECFSHLRNTAPLLFDG